MHLRPPSIARLAWFGRKVARRGSSLVHGCVCLKRVEQHAGATQHGGSRAPPQAKQHSDTAEAQRRGTWSLLRALGTSWEPVPTNLTREYWVWVPVPIYLFPPEASVSQLVT